MSRIGKVPVALPAGVEIKIAGGAFEVRGPKGELKRSLPLGIAIRKEGALMLVENTASDPQLKAMHGTVRAHLKNMVEGVTKGYEKVIEIHGVGFRAVVEGRKLVLSLGFTHPVSFPLPEGINVVVDAKINTITFTGTDKDLIGETVACVRRIKPPEPYKGFGLRRQGEFVRRKQGKTGLAKGAKA